MQTRIIDISKVAKGTQTEPVNLAYAKQHLRIDFTDDDSYLTTLITQCRKAVENYCFLSILPTTITLTIDYCGNAAQYPRGPGFGGTIYGVSPYDNSLNAPAFELPYGPTSSVTSVSYIDDRNVTTPLDPLAFDYYVRGVAFKSLQIVKTLYFNAVIVYDTGYTIGSVPDDLTLAILNELAFRMENRGDSTNRYASQQVGLSEGSQYLANPFKRLAWL